MALAVIGVILIGLVALAALGLVTWRASSAAMAPHRAPVRPQTLPPYEDVCIESPTGVELAGRFHPGRSGAAVVLSHGYGGNQDELAPIVAALHDEGLGVLTYDLRGCGRSGGTITFGALEQRDLQAAVGHLSTRLDVDTARIGAYGFSMGGATTLLAAAADTRIRAVATDAAWARATNWLRPGLNPRNRFSRAALRLVELRAGIDLDDLRPEDVVAAIAPRPLLLVHGADDDVVLPDDGRTLAARAGDAAVLWSIPEAGHGATIGVSALRVAEFFAGTLADEAAA